MITLNNLIEIYKDIALRHYQINDFAAVRDFNIDADNAPTYPILVVNPTGANLPRTENGYSSFVTTFDLQVIDLVNKDDNNEMDVLSDTQQILNDIVNEFNTHPYYIDAGIDTIDDISFEPLRGVYDSDVDGWKVSITLEHPNKLSFCGAPIENLSGFDFSPASVEVTDGDNTINLFPSEKYVCGAGDTDYKIDHSFFLDGINKTFQGAAPVSLNSSSTGTFSFGFKPEDIEELPSKYAFLLIDSVTFDRLEFRYQDGQIRVTLISGGVLRWAKLTIGFISNNLWLNILLSHNGIEVALTINGVPVGLTNSVAPNDNTKWIDSVAPDLINVGSLLASSDYCKMNFQQLSYFTNVLTATEAVDFNNRNRPKDPVTEFGTNTLMSFNSDNSGSAAQFTITDGVEGLTLLSENLVNTDKTTETTY